jgi:hypothetical protein
MSPKSVLEQRLSGCGSWHSLSIGVCLRGPALTSEPIYIAALFNLKRVVSLILYVNSSLSLKKSWSLGMRVETH